MRDDIFFRNPIPMITSFKSFHQLNRTPTSIQSESKQAELISAEASDRLVSPRAETTNLPAEHGAGSNPGLMGNRLCKLRSGAELQRKYLAWGQSKFGCWSAWAWLALSETPISSVFVSGLPRPGNCVDFSSNTNSGCGIDNIGVLELDSIARGSTVCSKKYDFFFLRNGFHE